jgi:hypothetical protein
MSNPTSPQTLLTALADRLGVGPVTADDDHVSVFSFGEIDVLVSADDQSLTIFARLGEAPRGDAEFLESLLEANLFWQDTGGATLSLEPFSRMVLLALRWTPVQADSLEALESAIVWTRTIDRLRRDSASALSTAPPAPADLIHRA